MNDSRVERRLAAILAADVVNYSGLMGKDEVGTRARLNAMLNDIVLPALAAHRGRMFKTMGDGLLAEFASVVDAVDCAVAIQTVLAKPDPDAGEPLRLRIGINLGDIIVEDDDIHGDGVNIAARLEALADPGGICISRSARDQIRDKLAYGIEDLGEIEVKNIARPVRAFNVIAGPAEATRRAQRRPAVSAGSAAMRRRLPLFGALAAALAIAIAGLLWWTPWAPRVETASVAQMRLPLPDKPSVAILPFDVNSADPGDRLLADAINEDLTRGLARVSGLFVIARNSTLAYTGKNAAPARVAEELGVRHVVRASLRRNGNRVRIDAELADAISGRIVWSDRFDRASEDLFALQDDLVQALASRLARDLSNIGEERRFTDDVEAYFLWFEADRESWLNTPAAYGKARALGQAALERDPGFVRARALLAFVDTQSAYFGLVDDPQATLLRAHEAAAAAVAAQPGDWYTQSVYAQTLLNMRDYESALAAFDKAIELEPAHAALLTRSTLPLIFLGRGREAEERLRVAIRLNPFHDWLPDQLLGQALFIQQRYRDAVASLEEAHRQNPRFIGNFWWRAAAYGQLGQTEAAQAAVAELLERSAGATISSNFIQITDEAAMARFVNGLHHAGMPE